MNVSWKPTALLPTQPAITTNPAAVSQTACSSASATTQRTRLGLISICYAAAIPVWFWAPITAGGARRHVLQGLVTVSLMIVCLIGSLKGVEQEIHDSYGNFFDIVVSCGRNTDLEQ